MERRCVNDNLEDFGPAYDVEASQQIDAEIRLDLVINQRYIFRRKTNFSHASNFRLALIFATLEKSAIRSL